MSDVIGPMAVGEQNDEVFIGREWMHSRNFSEDTARIVDSEVRKLIEEAHANCHRLLTENMKYLHAIADALLDRETITGDDIDIILADKPLPKDSEVERIDKEVAREEAGTDKTPNPYSTFILDSGDRNSDGGEGSSKPDEPAEKKDSDRDPDGGKTPDA